jgi:zinc transport system ATP-binding protein
MAQIECRDLCLGYEGREIVHNLNFAVFPGDYLVVLGENGAGKSTLMRTVLGLRPPMGGQVLFGDGIGKNEIGYLPQQTQVQKDFPASVTEIVLSGFEGQSGLRPFRTKEQKRIAEDVMEKTGLTELRKRCYRELSGGQQQRVLLARALCATRKLLLLDEPATGLDPLVTGEIYGLIGGLNRRGTTVVMITHDVEAALRYATKILHVGPEPFFGTPSEYLASEVGRTFAERLAGPVSAAGRADERGRKE